MPAHCTHEPLSPQAKPSLAWDRYQEAAFEMWEMAGPRQISNWMLEQMANRLREYFPDAAND